MLTDTYPQPDYTTGLNWNESDKVTTRTTTAHKRRKQGADFPTAK